MSLLEGTVKGKPAQVDFRDDVGFHQQLWAVIDPSVLKQAVETLRSTPLFIADGHHRYETALNYQKLRRQQNGSLADRQPYDSVLMLLTALEDPGLTVLPTHRVTTTPLPPYDHVQSLLSATFDLQEFPFTAATQAATRAKFIETMRSTGRTIPVFGLAIGAGLGALMGKVTKSGVDKAFQDQVRGLLQPGTSALFLMVEKVTPDKAVEAMSKYGGTVLKTSLSKEGEADLQDALHGGAAS